MSDPAYSDFDDYFGRHSTVSPALHAHLRAQANMSGAAIRRADVQYAKDVDAYYDERDRLREEFEARLAAGAIRLYTRRERLERTAAGHPDNPSVQAARRLLTKLDAVETTAA